MRIKGLRKMTTREQIDYNTVKRSYLTSLSDEEIKESLIQYGKKLFAWDNIEVIKFGEYEWRIGCMGDGREDIIFIFKD